MVDDPSSFFAPVAKHLRVGGHSYSFQDVDGVVEGWLGFFETIARSPAMADDPEMAMIADLDLRSAFDELGLLDVKAIGQSGSRVGSGTETRSFYYVPEGRKGLLSMAGGAAQPTWALSVAPAGADLVLEQEVHLSKLPGVVDSLLKVAGRADEREMLKSMLDQPMQPLSMTIGQFVKQADTRMLVVVETDKSRRISMPDSPELPGFKILLGLADTEFLFKDMGELLTQQGFVVAANTPEYARIVAPGPMGGPGAPLGENDIIGFHFDKQTGHTYVATDVDYLDQCLAGANPLTADPAFEELAAGLPLEGNGFHFISSEVREIIESAIEQMIEQDSAEAAEARMGMEVVMKFLPFPMKGAALGTVVNHPDGMLVISRRPGHESMAGIPMGGGVTTVAIMASLAVPVFSKIQEKANQTKGISNARQVVLACKIYADDFDGKYPANLQQLVQEEVIPAESSDLLSWEGAPWLLFKGLSDSTDGSHVLIAAPSADATGHRIVGFNDGSVRSMPEAEYQRILQRNKQTEP